MTAPDPLIATARRLIGMQGRDGLWGDFRMRPGESRDWVGAVAAFALAEAAGSGRLPPALATLARSRAERAADTLRDAARDGGWGYDRAIPPDSDSTAAVLRLFAALGQPVPAGAAAFLTAQGDPVAGWATYGPMRSWDAWSQPCPEVDAAVGIALALPKDDLRVLWTSRLAGGQEHDGRWRAYWWPGPGVATLAAIELWVAAGRPAPAPRLPAPADAGMSALDAVTLAHAIGCLDHAAGARALATACGRMQAPGRWPADAVLLAPRRYPASARGEHSPEGRGVLTTAAALRALVALPRMPAPPVRKTGPHPVATGLGSLARQLGLPASGAALAEAAGTALLGPLLGAPAIWPNRALSSLARGWPVEFSATLDPDPRPALRLAADLGDPRLSPAARARTGRASLARAARVLGLDPTPLTAALAPFLAAARQADPGERFTLWAGLDLADTPILKTYANITVAGNARDRLTLAARIVAAGGGIDLRDDLLALDTAIAAGFPQQMGLALTRDGLVAAKVYWELPAHDPAATARMAAALGLVLPDGFGPEIPGLASHADAARGLSGLAVRIDPGRGLRPELTLATQASRAIRWRDTHETRALADWAARLGLSAVAANRLTCALRAAGKSPRSLHTLTLGPGGRLRAAVYFHADGWLGARLSQRPDLPEPQLAQGGLS